MSRWTEAKPLKPKKCKACREFFTPQNGLQKVCSPKCAIEAVKIDREKAAKEKTRLAKVSLRSRRDWLKLAQVAFNQFIRARDAHLPCISCGRHHDGQYHAGHYLSTGASPELRFDESNTHKQCAPCNNHLSGNIALYRIALIRKVGLAEVERLESYHLPAKWTIEKLIEIRQKYLAKTKALKAGSCA